MKSFTYYLALLITLLANSPSLGADLMLRERATQHGAIIRLGDIADVGTSSSAELDALARTPLLPAPAKGTQQFLSVAQVRDLLQARGIQLDALTFQGASIVEIGGAVLPSKKEALPAVLKLSHHELEMRVQRAIERHLQNKARTGQWRVEVSLHETLDSKLVKLGAKLEVRSQQKLRSGKQRFLLSGSEGKKEIAISATITQVQSVVVVLRRVERGQIVRTADVELRTREGNLPRGSLTDLQQVVGKAAQRTLRSDEIVQGNYLRAAWQVLRGETVNVFVRTGGIVVRTRAIAKENGAMGELIAVETVEDEQRLNVSVSGPGEVTVYATGGQTTEYASLRRGDRRRR